MLGSLTHIPQRHSTGQCGPRLWCERMYTRFFFSSLGSRCCHPLCSCINRPGVTCPADSTFDCNCVPWWLTAVSPGWCGWKCVKQEGDHILCFPLVCLYLCVSVHTSWFPYSTVCIQELFYADKLLKTKSTPRWTSSNIFSWDIFYLFEMPLQAAVQHQGSSSVPLRSYWQSFYHQAECGAPCRTALLSLRQPDNWPSQKGVSWEWRLERYHR